jgi:putative hydrolase of the HAD superfamily
MLFDLDNTLVDRNMAFKGWAQRFLAEHGFDPRDLAWLATLDCGGYFPRPALFGALRSRYGLRTSLEELQDEYTRTMTALIRCPPAHAKALLTAREKGWVLGIVTNGAVGPQEAKIRRTGLADLVDGWVVSEAVAIDKPDPRIFRMAADRCGIPLRRRNGAAWTERSWMVGDHPPADIAGAALAGLNSAWIEHGRPWAELGYRPTLSAADLPEAVDRILAATPA